MSSAVTAGTDTAKYWLPRDVHACRIREGVVLLDIRRDKYFGIAGRQMRALSAVVPGWPATSPPAATEEPLTAEYCQHIAQLLVEQELLTADAQTGRNAAPVDLHFDAMPVSVGRDMYRRCPIRLVDVAKFVTACAVAWWWLKRAGLATAVERARRQKQASTTPPQQFDIERAAELVSVFRRLRPYFFTARNHCLFHALTLTKFLGYYGVFPTWVIGVKTTPWAAHSWVQAGHFMLDATPEDVSYYTPILAV